LSVRRTAVTTSPVDVMGGDGRRQTGSPRFLARRCKRIEPGVKSKPASGVAVCRRLLSLP
jgi:hypothetical protein